MFVPVDLIRVQAPASGNPRRPSRSASVIAHHAHDEHCLLPPSRRFTSRHCIIYCFLRLSALENLSPLGMSSSNQATRPGGESDTHSNVVSSWASWQVTDTTQRGADYSVSSWSSWQGRDTAQRGADYRALGAEDSENAENVEMRVRAPLLGDEEALDLVDDAAPGEMDAYVTHVYC
jgi:hypothetical protein